MPLVTGTGTEVNLILVLAIYRCLIIMMESTLKYFSLSNDMPETERGWFTTDKDHCVGKIKKNKTKKKLRMLAHMFCVVMQILFVYFA